MMTRIVFALLVLLPDTNPQRKSERVTGFLVSMPGRGVVRFDLEGRIVSEWKCAPYDARLAGDGTVIVTERQAGRVAILDADGRTVWEKTGLSSPVDAERLPRGHVLVLENAANQVVEFDADGREVWRVGGLSNAYDADRLPNGHTLVADSGHNRLVEFDREGRVVWEHADLPFPNSVLRLRDGRTWYTAYTSGLVGEIDAKGNRGREHRIEGSVVYSVAVEGADVWVSDGKNGRVLKLDRGGKILLERKLPDAFVDLAFLN